MNVLKRGGEPRLERPRTPARSILPLEEVRGHNRVAHAERRVRGQPRGRDVRVGGQGPELVVAQIVSAGFGGVLSASLQSPPEPIGCWSHAGATAGFESMQPLAPRRPPEHEDAAHAAAARVRGGDEDVAVPMVPGEVHGAAGRHSSWRRLWRNQNRRCWCRCPCSSPVRSTGSCVGCPDPLYAAA